MQEKGMKAKMNLDLMHFTLPWWSIFIVGPIVLGEKIVRGLKKLKPKPPDDDEEEGKDETW
jgi:hypothetical protein